MRPSAASGRAAEQRYEVAPFQLIELHPVPAARPDQARPDPTKMIQLCAIARRRIGRNTVSAMTAATMLRIAAMTKTAVQLLVAAIKVPGDRH